MTTNLQKELDYMKFKQTKAMLDSLAINCSEWTKVVETSKEVRIWEVVENGPVFSLFHAESRTFKIELLDFFGMRLGYSMELDTIFCWMRDQSKFSTYDLNLVQYLSYQLRDLNTLKLLRTLAIYFNRDTKFYPAREGSTVWPLIIHLETPMRIIVQMSDGLGKEPVPTKTILVPLVRFFGMYAGYNIESNSFVCWKI